MKKVYSLVLACGLALACQHSASGQKLSGKSKATALLQAEMDKEDYLEYGTSPTLKQYIREGADVNSQNPDGITPLHVAAAQNDLQLAELALKKGARVNVTMYERGSMPLHLAAWNNSAEVAALLLKHGAELEARNADGKTPLHLACWQNAPAVAKVLLAHGADVSARNKYGETPLHGTIFSHEVLSLLLAAGADINAGSEYGKTPLHAAIDLGSLETASVLIENGADVNAPDSLGETPLHLAAYRNQTDAVLLLLQHGASVHAKNHYGGTPVHLAILQRLEASFHALEHGVISYDETYNVWGNSDLDSWRFSASEVVTALLKAGADVNAVTKAGETPLHLASHQGDLETVKVLLESGADPSKQNKAGDTALSFATDEKIKKLISSYQKK